MSESPFSTKSTQIFLAFLVFAVSVAFIIYFVAKDKVVLSDFNLLDQTVGSNPGSSCTTCSVVLELPPTGLGGGGSGTKRAVLIGCNYKFPGSTCIRSGCTLNGCIEDVKDISNLLLSTCGYTSQNMTYLLDDGSTTFPTKQVILSSISRLIDLTQPNDTAFIWFSGHGAQIADKNADGGYDECWVSPDSLQSGNYIKDNELNFEVAKAKAGSRIFIGSDSCHSGTVFDLKYILENSDGSLNNKNLGAMRGRVPLRAFPEFTSNSSVASKLENALDPTPSRTIKPVNVIADSSFQESSATIVCLSACQDYDFAADAYIQGEYCGAMSWAFRQSFSMDSTLTEMNSNIRASLVRAGFTQVPQITLGKLLNPNMVTVSSIL